MVAKVPKWTPTIGNGPPTREAASFAGEEQANLNDRVLACLATWVREDGTVVEPTTGEIAARLGIEPRTYQRDELNFLSSRC